MREGGGEGERERNVEGREEGGKIEEDRRGEGRRLLPKRALFRINSF